MDTISLHYAGRRVMIFSHQVVVLCIRYIVETMGETEILAIDASGDVANCAITEYRFDPSCGTSGSLVLERYNVTAPLDEEATPVTHAPDQIAGARG
jgi:broad specificity phosphatase PhoE